MFGVVAFFLLPCAAATPAQQNFDLHVPRITAADLERNATLRSGHYAYVLKDYFIDKWSAANWTLEYLKDKIPFEWVDYYPHNMDKMGNKPHLHKFEVALPKFLEHSPDPRYMQIRIGLRGWQRLVKDFQPLPVPDVFWSDEEWIRDCMKKSDGSPDKPAINNFFVTNQWKFLLIGEKGTSMFLHKDGSPASTWQAQIVGRKRWTLCPNTETPYLSDAIDTFKPEHARHPGFAKALCGQVTAAPGDILYYPASWWHHTLQLDTPSIAYTGALVGVEADRANIDSQTKQVHRAFYDEMMRRCDKCWRKGNPARTCDDISKQWPGAAPPPLRQVCEEYLPRCLDLWDKHVRSLHGGGSGSVFEDDDDNYAAFGEEEL